MVESAPTRECVEMEPIYTVEEVAGKLKLTPFAVRILLREGRLKGFKLGKYWRIKESSIEQLVDSLTCESDQHDNPEKEITQ